MTEADGGLRLMVLYRFLLVSAKYTIEYQSETMGQNRKRWDTAATTTRLEEVACSSVGKSLRGL